VFALLFTFGRLARALRHGWKDEDFRGLLQLTVALLASGTVFYWWSEDWSILDSLYFSVTTLTTIGFGDPSPTTDRAKIFTIVYVLIGIGVLVAFLTKTAQLVSSDPGVVKELRERRKR
jgi:voltage-gated potassium channel